MTYANSITKKKAISRDGVCGGREVKILNGIIYEEKKTWLLKFGLAKTALDLYNNLGKTDMLRY